MMSSTIAEVVRRAAAADPEREAVVTRSHRLTYEAFDRVCDQAAHALHDLGIRSGDRCAVSLPNELDVIVAFHGAMRLGAIWVGINQALAEPEKAFQLDDSGATVLLSDAPVAGATTHRVDVVQWRELVAGASEEPVGGDVDPFAPAGIAYTSGTTGRPKGAVQSQWNLLLPGAALVASRGYGPELRKGDCLPFTILNMQVLTTLLTAQAGGTCVVMDQIFAQGVADWIRRERVTTWNGPPALLHSLAHDDGVAPEDLASLNEVWNGGADCPTAVRHAFEAKFAREILCTYGLTEAPAVVSIDPRGRPHRPGSSGASLEHVRVEIRDDAGQPVPTGESGEITIGPADDRYRFMLGYWQRPDATKHVLRDGVLHTGDVGFVDEVGELHVRDRLTLLINRGGANVYPAEVERVIYEVDGVAACAVFGVPDTRLGERVIAAVEFGAGHEPDLEVLRAYCTANLAKYKVPERFVVVASFERNAMGKIVRTHLPDLLTLPSSEI